MDLLGFLTRAWVTLGQQAHPTMEDDLRKLHLQSSLHISGSSTQDSPSRGN